MGTKHVGKEERHKILVLVEAGVPVKDLAKEHNIARATIYKWLSKKKQEKSLLTISNIKRQLQLLSSEEPTFEVSRKIATLASALARLERLAENKKRVEVKKKPIVTDITTNKEANDLKKRALSGEFGELYDYQKEFLRCNDQFRAVVKSRQIGFSFTAALDALIGAVAGRNQLFLSASEDQALILMRYVEYWAKKMEITFVIDKNGEKRLFNGAIIRVMANNFRTVQGFSGDIWMDEFAWYQNPKKIWLAFVPSIGAVGGRLTIMSTPFEEPSLFHKIITDDLKYYMFTRFKVDIYRAIKDGLKFDLETMKALFDADTWASAYECQFVDDEASLFSISLIKSCVDNTLSFYAPSTKRVIFSGYDIGRTAHRSALAGLVLEQSNYELAILDVLAKAPFDEQRLHLNDFMERYPLSQIKIDRTGIGMDLAEGMVKKWQSRASGVHFTPSSKESMALNLKKMFEDKIIKIPNDQMLIADIHAIKRKAGARGFLYDSKQNEYGHADRFWALALAGSHIKTIERKKRGGRGVVING